jgi:hypothetical protein
LRTVGQDFTVRRKTMRRPPGVRILWLFCATLQLLLPGLVALGDGQLQAQSLHRAGIAHIESHSTAACGHGHPQDCPLCQFLSHRLDVGRPITFAADVCQQRSSFQVASLPSLATVRQRLPDSRAPPLLS